MRTPKIAEAEWNFRPVPVKQEYACLIWELARESETMTCKIKERKQRGGSYVLNRATAVKFSAESFCAYFKYFLDYFPQTPWRDIPKKLASDDSPESGLNVLLSTFGERQAFTLWHGMTPAGPHLLPFRALVNLSYTDTAIQGEFAAWLAGERKRTGIVKGQVVKFGTKEQEGRGPKDKVRTDLKRLSIMRLMRVMTVEDAVKIENQAAKRAKESEFFGKHSEIEVWRQSRRKAEYLLQKYLLGVPPKEKPLSFVPFSEQKRKF